MPESPMVGQWSGHGFPRTGSNRSNLIASAAGRKEAEVVREALAQYLGRTDPGNVKGASPKPDSVVE